MTKRYLGDAVYAEVDRYGCLVLTTEDGIAATNTVVLEPEVLAALEQYVKAWRESTSERPPTEGETTSTDATSEEGA